MSSPVAPPASNTRDDRSADSQVALLRQFLPRVAGQPKAMAQLARQFAAAGDRETAVELALKASAQVARDSEAGVLCAELLNRNVPAWHFLIVKDELRNEAYQQALLRAVRPGCLVLEIGTGSGLLAMMAARAGARVVTCEADPAVAAVAREVIAANGLAERITVIAKHSTALDPVHELGGKADILVSEIVSNDLLSESVLPAHADATRRLLKPGAPVIPARGRVRIALADDRHAGKGLVSEAAGFDLSAFNLLGSPNYQLNIDGSRLSLRSEPDTLLDFDLAESRLAKDRRTVLPMTSTGGPVNGVVQWIALDLDAHGTYENRPGSGMKSSWAALFWPFAEPLETVPGQVVRIGAYSSQERVRIWHESEPSVEGGRW